MNYQKKNNTQPTKWQEFRKWLVVFLELIAIGFVVWVVVFFLQGLGIAEGCKGRCWAMCSPSGYVNIREKPSTGSSVIGWLDSGDAMTTDWETKGEWLHIVDAPLERDEGWVSSRYLVYDEPVFTAGAEAIVVADGRVAIRQYIDGPRVTGKAGWAKPGETLQVFWWSREWSLTNRGYIQSQYLYLEVGK